MWQNLVLSFIAGWTGNGIIRPILKRRRAGHSLREALTNSQDRARRRIPRPSEVP